MDSLLVWSTVTLIILLRTYVSGGPTEKLHHHMTKREIQYYFNVDDHDKVPEYEVSNPYQSNDEGEFVSYSLHPARAKRSLGLDDFSSFKLNAFGSNLHLKLKRNEHLISPGLKVLRENSDGSMTSYPVPENTYYLGHVASDPSSTVAVSNNGGLTGIVKTSRESLFVHPLPAHLAKHVTSSEDATPHLVHRRSVKEEVISLKNDVMHMVKEDPSDDENSRVKRSMMSHSPVPKFKTLKVALMCPPSLQKKYSQGNLQAITGGLVNYFMILANMVAGMFQDPSIGKMKITYVVTRILIIDPVRYGFKQSDSNSIKLSRIARKTRENNAIQKVPFDVFSYISDKISGGALAIANQICAAPTGNVNQEIGLPTSLHLAHETGHNMYLDHTSGDCALKAYIMNAALPGGPHATEWSECSRNVIQRFLADEKKSKCLDDGPVGDHPTILPSFRGKLPGKIISGDEQCVMHYGEGWKQYNPSNCVYLSCIKEGTLLGRNTIVADGTECGFQKWCIKGRCEQSGMVENITWSEWGPYSQCTRDCDGGIQHRERHCVNAKPRYGKNCKGVRKEYRLCNPQDCPSEEQNFRNVYGQQVCKGRNPNYFLYNLARDACGIYCREGNLVRRIGTFKDGIRCTNNRKDRSVCVQGKCRSVGCDNELDGKTAIDRCGVCGGDGDTCSKIKATFKDSPAAAGPENAIEVAELPVGTRNAGFVMVANTLNYLGVIDAQGKFIVGGHLGGNQEKPAAGTVIKYTHRNRPAARDVVTIVGPTNASLRVMYIKRSPKTGDNPGVMYQYLIQGSSSSSSLGYKWVVGEWSTCSRTCAVGTRTRDVRCIRIDDESPASNSACPGEMPAVEDCNTQPCAAKWTQEWTSCSKTCGNGHQQRQLKCLHEVALDDFRETDLCSEPKPVNVGPALLACNRYPCPAAWNVGPWSACPTKCAVGMIRREVSCSRIDESGNLTIIDPEFCRYMNKPLSEMKCNENKPCGSRPPTCPPIGHNCSNGGSCQPDPSGYKCVCDKGFTGVECEIKLNPCDKKPCLNGGECSAGIIHHYNHTCKCPPLFTGRNCETKITACMSNPCLNGATCDDKGLSDEYTCTCPQGLTGQRCQVSEFYRIGCFNHKENVIPKLADLRKEVNLKDTQPTIMKCAELAQEKGFKYFSVGLNGICFSGPKAGESYFTKGAAPNKKCAKGIGSKASSVVFTFESVPSYKSLGCYVASAKKRPKPLRIRYINFRNQKNKQNGVTVDQCARVAKAKGYAYFAVQNTAECWSDVNAKDTYDDLGPSQKCKGGIGLKGANMVYQFNE